MHQVIAAIFYDQPPKGTFSDRKISKFRFKTFFNTMEYQTLDKTSLIMATDLVRFKEIEPSLVMI